MFKQFLKYSFFTSAGIITIWDNICYYSRVDGASMKPLINENNDKKDYVFVMRLFNPLHLFVKKPLIEDMVTRGEVVSLVSPKNPNECFIKRIIGMPGDLVKTIHYKQKYVVVPQGHCWVEGDNFESSYDSNAFGCVPLGLIVGKVKLILYPLDRISILNNNFPKHRKLCKLKKEYDEKYFVDFKSSFDHDDYNEEDKNE